MIKCVATYIDYFRPTGQNMSITSRTCTPGSTTRVSPSADASIQYSRWIRQNATSRLIPSHTKRLSDSPTTQLLLWSAHLPTSTAMTPWGVCIKWWCWWCRGTSCSGIGGKQLSQMGVHFHGTLDECQQLFPADFLQLRK